MANKGSFPSDTKYYDNPFCDAFCPQSTDVSFNCTGGVCETVGNLSGQYKNYTDCISECGDKKRVNYDDTFLNENTFWLIVVLNAIIVCGIIFFLKR